MSGGLDLAAEDLVLRYGDKAVLDRVSLALPAGALIGLVGPNGAGKTSLLRALAGLVAPDSGSVRFDGQIMDAGAIASSGLVAYLPQHHAAHWPVSVETLVSLGQLGRRSRPMPKDDRQAAIDTALDDLDLRVLRRRSVDTLSGGEQARAHLARAVAQNAPILLADEPVADLDPHHACAVMGYLQTLAQSKTVVVVLHDLVLAQRYCARIVVLADGRTVADDTPEAALTADVIQQVYGVRTVRAEADGASVIVPWDLG